MSSPSCVLRVSSCERISLNASGIGNGTRLASIAGGAPLEEDGVGDAPLGAAGAGVATAGPGAAAGARDAPVAGDKGAIGSFVSPGNVKSNRYSGPSFLNRTLAETCAAGAVLLIRPSR